MDVVIIGAGQAGAWVARSLREAGHEGGITLLGREPHAPYERPPMSKAVLSGAEEHPPELLGPQQQMFKILVHFGLKGLLYKREQLSNQER